MNSALIKQGSTYRSILGGWDYYIEHLGGGNVGYVVMSGPMRGRRGRADVKDFAERLRCVVRNHDRETEESHSQMEER